MAQILDGKLKAQKLRDALKGSVKALKDNHSVQPCLAVILVGDDPASHVYVGSKVRQCAEIGMRSLEHRLDQDISQEALLELIETLNQDHDVDGILVQMPLPDHLDMDRIVMAIDPDKDVDGLHPVNAGRLVLGKPALVPCTPQGCMLLIEEVMGKDLSGKNAVVLGRSILVGKPVSLLLQSANATVTMAHSRTKKLEELCSTADILVAAVGRPHLVKKDWVKPGACLIDVGINRIDAPEKGAGKTRLIGDIDYEAVQDRAGAITPVPGGVGPMTVACLLLNTFKAAHARRGLALSPLYF